MTMATHFSWMHSLRAAAVLALALPIFVGCDRGPKYVPVSGVIKLNGKPYGEAVVSFQPIATQGNDSPGSGSTSFTDATGRYTLKSADGHDGAVIGKHRVRIMSKGNLPVIDYATQTSPDNVTGPSKADPIPRSWNVDSDKEFVVPASGTKDADFDIPTPARP